MKVSRISLTDGSETDSALDYYDSFSEKANFLSTRIGVLDTIARTHRARYAKYKILLVLAITSLFVGTPLWVLYGSKEENRNSCFLPILCSSTWTTWALLTVTLLGFALITGWMIVQGGKQLRETIRSTIAAFNVLDNSRCINWKLLENCEYKQIVRGKQSNPPSELQEIIIFEFGRVFPETIAVGIEKHQGVPLSLHTDNSSIPVLGSALSEKILNV